MKIEAFVRIPVGDAWLPSRSGESVDNLNPATGELRCHVEQAWRRR